jgi:hypothetical protein
MAVETLMLGVRGKLAMWTAFERITDKHPGLKAANLGELIARAQSQLDALERERLRLAEGVL